MKKVLMLSLALFVAGVAFADKKDKKEEGHKTEACAKKDGGKACCKKDGEAKVTANADGTTAPMSSCNKASAGKPCCQKKEVSAPVQDAKPSNK
jgi:hypothetical protein